MEEKPQAGETGELEGVMTIKGAPAKAVLSVHGERRSKASLPLAALPLGGASAERGKRMSGVAGRSGTDFATTRRVM